MIYTKIYNNKKETVKTYLEYIPRIGEYFIYIDDKKATEGHVEKVSWLVEKQQNIILTTVNIVLRHP